MRKYFIIAALVLMPTVVLAASADSLQSQSNPQTEQSSSLQTPAAQSNLQPASEAAQPSNLNTSQSTQDYQIISNYLAGEADGSPHSVSVSLFAKILQLVAIALAVVAFVFFARALTTSKKAAS